MTIKAIDTYIPVVIRAYELASDRKSWESFRDEFVRNIKLGKKSDSS